MFFMPFNLFKKGVKIMAFLLSFFLSSKGMAV